MRRYRLRFALVGVGVLLAVAACNWSSVVGLCRGEAFFRGCSASGWGHRLTNGPPSAVAASDGELAGGGAEAVPVLVELLHRDPATRLAALRVVQRVGPPAAAAIPHVLACATADLPSPWNEYARSAVADALGGIGPAAVPALAVLAAGDDPHFAREAIRVLGELGADAKPATPALAMALRNGSGSNRTAAADVLAALGPAAVPELTAAAMAGDGEAIRALGVIGPGAVAAVPVLVERLADSHSQTGREAATALARIGTAAVPGLTAGLSHERSSVRDRAAMCLASLKANAAPAVPALTRLLDDETGRFAAVFALGEIGPDALAALPRLLIVYITSPVLTEWRVEGAVELDVRHAAATAIWKINRVVADRVGIVVRESRRVPGDSR